MEISIYLTIHTLPFSLQIGMTDDVTGEFRHTGNHGIEDDELCQMTIDGTSRNHPSGKDATVLLRMRVPDDESLLLTPRGAFRMSN